MPKVDTFGNFDGGKICPAHTYLNKYMFSIVIENYVSKFFFTEKLLNCFAALTIPIYIGASTTNDLFNEAGIIRVTLKSFDDIGNIIKIATRGEYEARLPYAIDNYFRVSKFPKPEDFIFEKYLSNDKYFSNYTV
jgi:hypothetical protein